MSVKAIGDNILFQFVDAINTRNEFTKGTTDSGIVIAGDTFDASAKESRWCEIVGVGDRVQGFNVGDRILLPALRWTEGVKHGDDKFWMTREKEIVARIPVGEPNVIYAHGDWVVFQRIREERMKSFGIISVVSAEENYIRGTVATVGDKVDQTQLKVGDVIMFVDPNFIDTAKFNGQELCFVREESILAVEEK